MNRPTRIIQVERVLNKRYGIGEQITYTQSRNVFRLNDPNTRTGGAREERGVEGDTGCEWRTGFTIKIATRLTTAMGTDATIPLCDTIWQDQAQMDE